MQPVIRSPFLCASASPALSRGLFRREKQPRHSRCGRRVSSSSRLRSYAFVAQGAGRIQSRYVSQVGFEVGGRLTSREVDVGAVVKKGQRLAQLSAIDYQNKVTAAEADLAAAKAAVAQAAPQEERYRILHRERLTRRGRSTRMRSRRCRAPKRRSSRPKPIFASRRTS